MEEVNKLNKDNPLMVVLGNKNDITDKEVQEQDIKVSYIDYIIIYFYSLLVRCIM